MKVSRIGGAVFRHPHHKVSGIGAVEVPTFGAVKVSGIGAAKGSDIGVVKVQFRHPHREGVRHRRG